MYTLTLPQSRKSRGRLPSIPPILPRQLVSRRGLSSAQPGAESKGAFGPLRRFRSDSKVQGCIALLEPHARRCKCSKTHNTSANADRESLPLTCGPTARPITSCHEILPLRETDERFAEKRQREIFVRSLLGNLEIFASTEYNNSY